MATKKKPSAAQLAARKKFVEMVRAKAKAKKSTTKKAKPSVKKSSTHKDTKSHNVNIRVVSGTKKLKSQIMSGIQSQLKRNINGRIYVCEFITADNHKAKIKANAYKEIGISAKIIKLSKDKRPVYGVFVD